ncbi:unnamed protein product [Protopolystoma xenopodis]|uniref:Uncharacterized protein n=1 Tax=Protopolystoma xenopodis TaxID=117903 RepID=A0A448XP36_9PLAT|nr:unnamed protein product [Protopolystoma xenopodis]
MGLTEYRKVELPCAKDVFVQLQDQPCRRVCSRNEMYPKHFSSSAHQCQNTSVSGLPRCQSIVHGLHGPGRAVQVATSTAFRARLPPASTSTAELDPLLPVRCRSVATTISCWPNWLRRAAMPTDYLSSLFTRGCWAASRPHQTDSAHLPVACIRQDAFWF